MSSQLTPSALLPLGPLIFRRCWFEFDTVDLVRVLFPLSDLCRVYVRSLPGPWKSNKQAKFLLLRNWLLYVLSRGTMAILLSSAYWVLAVVFRGENI